METFTRLYPDRAEGLSPVDLASELPGRGPDDRPFVCLNMISTADGRATVKGRAGHIANHADYELFHATRARMDAIMVGAETIRVESYGRAINSAEARERREREGLPADIATVVVTRRVSLPADVGLLKAAENTVIVLTPSEDGALPAEAKATVEYLREPDIAEGLRRLRREHGIRSLVCEGGPNLNATLLPAGLIDELHLVYAPKLAGGHDPLTILGGDELDPPIDLELITLHESGGYLFCRYRVLAAG
jgi:5-amino-6-(5-phosphoribosylamino)uracil reductase